VYLNNVKTERIQYFFAALLSQYTKQEILSKESLISLADLIYIEGTKAYLQQNPSVLNNKDKYYVKFRKFEELIEQHYIAEKSPSGYANMLNMTSKHLNRITQAVVGKTASDVISERVMLEAKKEIILQKNSFAEIAYSLGYDDYAYFSKLFRKKTGATPSEFLKIY
jgi:AraC family transcriptional activator of pobA